MSSYLHPQGAALLSACVVRGAVDAVRLTADELTQLSSAAPLVAQIITMFTAWGAHHFHVPVWRSLWENLVRLAGVCADGPDAGPLLAEPEPPSWGGDACLRTGICSGLPRVRERHPCALDRDVGGADGDDGAADAACRHAFAKRRETTGGLFSVFCRHGVCLAFFILKGAEGRDDLYSFLVQYFRVAPKVVVYDFACGLEEFALNRAPGFFKDTFFVVDRFHWSNHTACSWGYRMAEYPWLLGFNSQAAEQSNSRMTHLKAMASSMKQATYMYTLRYCFMRANTAKENLVQQRLRSR